MKTISAALFCTAAALLTSQPASAATEFREENVNAPGICKAAFSDQVVRNRPTGVRNTGTTPIYVTCSSPGYFEGGTTSRVYIRVANFGTASQTVGCNLQPGWSNGITNTTVQGALPKNVVLGANTFNWLDYNAADYPSLGGTFYNVNFTCLLQPNTEIQYMGRWFEVEVGA